MGLSDSSFNLNDIAIFVEVAKRQSIARTAESFDVPATTLSRRLQALESRLGVQLLARSTRHIALTEAGRLYFDRCRLLVEQALDAHDVLREQGVKPVGTLKVLLPDPLEALQLSAAVQSFAQQWPELDCCYDYHGGQHWQTHREFDIALRWGRQADSDLLGRCLAVVPFRLYASRNYLARHGTPTQPRELLAHQCIGSSVCDELALWTLARGNDNVAIGTGTRLRSNDLEIARRFALAGAGIAALPAMELTETGLVPVLPSWSMGPIRLYALYASRTPPARARAFVDFLSARLPLSFTHLQSTNNPDRNDQTTSRLGQAQLSKVDTWALGTSSN